MSVLLIRSQMAHAREDEDEDAFDEARDELGRRSVHTMDDPQHASAMAGAEIGLRCEQSRFERSLAALWHAEPREEAGADFVLVAQRVEPLALRLVVEHGKGGRAAKLPPPGAFLGRRRRLRLRGILRRQASARR